MALFVNELFVSVLFGIELFWGVNCCWLQELLPFEMSLAVLYLLEFWACLIWSAEVG